MIKVEKSEKEGEEIKILLVEDLEEHVLITKNVLKTSNVKNKMWICRDGQEALDFLFNRADYASEADYPRPDVILLDLRLPKIDGLEVLKQIKNDDTLKDIPVIVLTSSKRDDDIITAYNGGAKSYILKSAFIVQKTGKMEKLVDILVSLR